MKIENLKAQAKTVLEIISKNHPKAYATIALLEWTVNTIKIVATDGFILYRSNEVPCDTGIECESARREIPIEVVKLLAAGKVVEYVGDMFICGGVSIAPSSIKFPNYKQVLDGFLGSKESEKVKMQGDFLAAAKHMGKFIITLKTEGVLIQGDKGTLIVCGMVEG